MWTSTIFDILLRLGMQLSAPVERDDPRPSYAGAACTTRLARPPRPLAALKEYFMKAVILQRFGDPEVLSYQDVPVPEPAAGQALVRVKGIGVNYGDTVVRAGGAPIAFEFPLILGSEAAGIVEQIGPGVTNVVVGDRVAAPMFMAGRLGGAYTELVAIDANVLVPLPEALSSWPDD